MIEHAVLTLMRQALRESLEPVHAALVDLHDKLETLRPAPVPVMLSIRQVADAVGVKPPTVRSWINKGLLPAVSIGNVRRVRRCDFEALLLSNATSNREVADEAEEIAQTILLESARKSKG